MFWRGKIQSLNTNILNNWLDVCYKMEALKNFLQYDSPFFNQYFICSLETNWVYHRVQWKVKLAQSKWNKFTGIE